MSIFVELHLRRCIDVNGGLQFEVLLTNDDGEEDDNGDQNDQDEDDDESAQRILNLIRCKCYSLPPTEKRSDFTKPVPEQDY